MKQTTVTGKVLGTGYVGNKKLKNGLLVGSAGIWPPIFEYKYKKPFWDKGDWPPRKIVIMEVPDLPKKTGKPIGRPRVNVSKELVLYVRSKGLSLNQVAMNLGIGKATVYRILKEG